MDDLAIISKETEKAYRLVRNFIKRHKSLYTGGCRTFYTPSEWKYRREEYCLDALLIVVYDGSDVRELFNPIRRYDLMDKFIKYLDDNGYYFENGTHWYSGIYKK